MALTTQERRSTIVAQLRSTGFCSVTALSDQLGVSDVTIRSDLSALERQHLVTRIHGGAMLASNMTDSVPSPRREQTQRVWRQVVRTTAELVQDGDSIVLDASDTALALAEFLAERQSLTVFTNGIEVARRFAELTTHTVVLTGGVVRRGENALSGQFGARLLADLRVRLAILACTGWSHALDPMDDELLAVEMKTVLCAAAQQIVVAAPSSSFGREGVAPFVALSKLHRVVTDDGLTEVTQGQLHEAGIALTICGTERVEWREGKARRQYRIGFGNQDDGAPFSTLVRQGLAAAAAAHGVELLLADNREDGPRALANAEYFIRQNVDLVVEFNTNLHYNNIIMDRLRAARLPVIAIDIPMPGATFFGVDNYRYGLMAGRLLGQYAVHHWSRRVDAVLSLDLPASGPTPAARMQGQLDGLREFVAVPDEAVLHLDSRNSYQDSYRVVVELLPRLQDREQIAILGINDETVLGALAAFAEADLLDRVLTVGLGADQESIRELKREQSRMIGAVASFPERYGETVITMALQMLRGQPVPPAVYTNHIYVLPDATIAVLDLGQLDGDFVRVNEYRELHLTSRSRVADRSGTPVSPAT